MGNPFEPYADLLAVFNLTAAHMSLVRQQSVNDVDKTGDLTAVQMEYEPGSSIQVSHRSIIGAGFL